jgi:hypothetical protein
VWTRAFAPAARATQTETGLRPNRVDAQAVLVGWTEIGEMKIGGSFLAAAISQPDHQTSAEMLRVGDRAVAYGEDVVSDDV